MITIRELGLTVDFNEYAKNGLENAKGSKNNKEFLQAADTLGSIRNNRVPEKYRPATLEDKKKAMTDFTSAFQEILFRANEVEPPEERFDIQRQIVAAVTMEVAQKAGIASNSKKMTVLADQMSHLWINTNASDNATPLAIELFANKLAENLDLNTLSDTYSNVSRYARTFALANSTDLKEEITPSKY